MLCSEAQFIFHLLNKSHCRPRSTQTSDRLVALAAFASLALDPAFRDQLTMGSDKGGDPYHTTNPRPRAGEHPDRRKMRTRSIAAKKKVMRNERRLGLNGLCLQCFTESTSY